MDDARLVLIELRRGSEYVEQTKKLGKDIYEQAKLMSISLGNIAQELCPGKMNLQKLDRCAKIMTIYMYAGAMVDKYGDEAAYCVQHYAYESYLVDPSGRSSCPKSIDLYHSELQALEDTICRHPSAGTFENFYIVSRYITEYASLVENFSSNSRLVYEFTKSIRNRLEQDVSSMTYEQYLDFCMAETKNTMAKRPGLLNRIFSKR